MVSIMKMNACSVTIRMWKIAQPSPSTELNAVPTRPVAALAFATAKDQFEPTWHWTADEYDGSGAWGQGFTSGGQGSTHKSTEFRVRAVRLIQLTA